VDETRGAIRKTETLPDWFHSDQGSEYASEDVGAWLTKQGVTVSMNPKGSPWCNGSQESFFGRFKTEFGDFRRFDIYADLLEELYSQLNYFTNIRIKTKLKMSPAKFREKWEIRQLELSTGCQSPPHPLFPPFFEHAHRAGCATLELLPFGAPLRTASADSG
jgi:transposase InsO family protein